MKDEKYIVLVLLILLGGLMLIVGIISIGKFPMLFVIGLFLIFFFPVILLKYPKYTAPILFMTAGVFIISFGIFLGWRSVIFEHDSQGNRFLVVIPCLLGGLIVIIAGLDALFKLSPSFNFISKIFWRNTCVNNWEISLF